MQTVELFYDQKVTLTIAPKDKADVNAVRLTGVIASASVGTAGTGYAHVPTISFIGAHCDVPATAHATINVGGVASIVIDSGGEGYEKRPTILITPDPLDTIGTPAVATAVMTTAAVVPEWSILGIGTLDPAVGGLTCDVISPDEVDVGANTYPVSVVRCVCPAMLALGEPNTDLTEIWRVVFKAQSNQLLHATTGTPGAK